MCVFFRALSSNSVFINPIHWLQSVHWAVKSNSSLDKYAAGVSFHTQTHLFLLFMGHKLGCLSLCSLQHEVNVSALQAHKKKKRGKKRKSGKKTGNKTAFFAFLFSQNIWIKPVSQTRKENVRSAWMTRYSWNTRGQLPRTQSRDTRL